MRALLGAVFGAALILAAGCGSSDSPGGAAGAAGAAGGGAGGAAGGSGGGSGGAAGSDGGKTGGLEKFATLSSAAGGLAFAKDSNGKTALFVSLTSDNKIVRVDATGAVGDVASIPAPMGLALAADGSLLVCGQGAANDQAMIYKLTPADGQSAPFVYDATAYAGKTFVAVAVAPDDRLVFSDAGSAIYRADKDGTNVSYVTAVIAKPQALAFSADGKTLYASSFANDELWTVVRNASIGNFVSPQMVASGLTAVSGAVVLESGDLVLVGGGVLRTGPDGSSPTTLVSPADLTNPEGAAFGVGSFGDTTLYVGNGSEIDTLALTDKAVALPVR